MFKGKKYKVSERRYKQVMDEVKDRVEYVAEHNTQGLDAEDAHRAFVKFRQTLQASTEEAVATINGWIKKAESLYKETELAELLSAANECMDKAVGFAFQRLGRGFINFFTRLLLSVVQPPPMPEQGKANRLAKGSEGTGGTSPAVGCRQFCR